MVDILSIAKRDLGRVWQHTSLTFFRESGIDEVTVKGVHSRIHLDVDTDTGAIVNTLKVHCSVSEKLLIEKGFTTRNIRGDIDLANKSFVRFNDGTGCEKVYKIIQTYPDDTLGLIVCMLGILKQKDVSTN